MARRLRRLRGIERRLATFDGVLALNSLLKQGLVRLLEAYDFEVAAAVDDGPSLLRALLEQRPDVAVVDVRLPPSHTDEGPRAALEARRQIPGLPVLVPSRYVEQLYARELLADGWGAVGKHIANIVANIVAKLDLPSDDDNRRVRAVLAYLGGAP